MKDKQGSYFDMLSTVSGRLTEYAAVWFDNPACAALCAKVNAAVTGMHQSAMAQGGALSTGDKADRREALQEVLLRIAKGLRAYAIVTNKPDLLKDANLTQNKLAKSSEMALLGIYKRTADIATSYLADLAPYGVTAVQLTDLTTRATAFSAMIGKPAAQRQRNKEATAQLEAFRKSGMDACNLLDHLVPIFEATSADFVYYYFAARKLRKPAHRKRALQLRITGPKGTPVYNAMVSIPSAKLKRWSTAKGQVYIQHLKAGKHKLLIEAEGYPIHEQEVGITANVRHVVDVRLGAAI